MKRIFITTLLISLIGLLNLTAQERIYTPELMLPENGAVDQMPDVVLDWNAVTGGNTGIIKYDIQLDTDPAFATPVNFQTEFLTAVHTSNLYFGETYYWHVRALDGSDVSPWSETRSFRVIRRVILTSPADGSTQNDTVKFQWSAITGLLEYDYQFDTVYFWKPSVSNQTVTLYGVSVVDDTHAWIVGAGGLVLFNDGTSWVEQESNLSTDLYSVNFLDANNGWAVGKGGKIIHYDGTAWTAQTNDSVRDLTGVSMLDANNGWAVGKNGIVLHYDGSQWTSQYHASKDLNSVFALDGTHVWAVGKAQSIIFYNGTSWSVQETGGTLKDFYSVGFTSPDHGWVVGKTGYMMRYDGVSWSLYTSANTKDLFSVYFIGPDNGYAVGATGTLLAYDGIDWSSQSATTTANLKAVGFSGTTGFLAGETGVVIAYNDEAFSSPMATIRHADGDTTAVKINDLLFGTQYYWRMRAKHSLDISEWSGARSFNTRATVVLQKPDDNDIDVNLDELLTWKKQFSDMVSYEIQIDDDPAYGSPVLLSTTDVEVNAELLKFGTLYHWRVRALNAFDISDWTSSWSFTTVNSVTLESPTNNESDVKLSPLLTWTALTGLAGYQVNLATNSNFASLLVDEIVPVEANSFNVPIVLDKDMQYFWRVRAVNGLDTSGWSSIWSFRTLPPVGIDEQGLSNKLNVYPNPAENTVYIQLKEKLTLALQLTITDLVGKKVLEKEFQPASGIKTVPFDVSSLQNGIYILRIADKESTFTKKLIIKR
jgi:photosystem II stability/assembly factor-like uncharacterized protein